MAEFPTQEWLTAFEEKLNSDNQYAEIAKNWEGDIIFSIHPDGKLDKQIEIYLDLWHGQCRDAYFIENGSHQPAAFTLAGDYDDFIRILTGELHPMQAMLTRKLNVKGSMGILMRNVPTVLDFVRCAQEVTDIA